MTEPRLSARPGMLRATDPTRPPVGPPPKTNDIERLCSSCPAVLSRYNAGDVCGSCDYERRAKRRSVEYGVRLTASKRAERNLYILQECAKGVSERDVADATGLSRSRVKQIVAAAKGAA